MIPLTPTTPPPPVVTAKKRRRFSRWQRLVIWFLALLVVITAALVGLALYTESQMNDAGSLPALAPGDGIFLIVGSDSRENLPDDLGNFGDFPGARADVIILAQVANGRRQLLSIPRDLKVDVPGHGTQKINAAFALGGPDLLVETIALATGIRANHYIEVEFGGFAAIVDALGGIELEFAYPARDPKSGLLVEGAGTQTLNGGMALAYARSRTYEEFQNGEWVSSGVGDIARTGRQRLVLVKILSKASSPSGLLRSPLLLSAVGSYVTSDSGTNVFTLARTGWAMQTAAETDSVALPVTDFSEGGVSYVVRSEPAATAVIDAFVSKSPLPAP